MAGGVTWTEDVSVAIDFAVRVLEHDGLRVAPFVDHAESDGVLRRFGFDAASWLEWVSHLIANERALASEGAGLESPLRRSPAIDRMGAHIDVLEHPWRSFPGGPDLQAELRVLWEELGPGIHNWRHEYLMSALHLRLGPGQQRNLARRLSVVPGLRTLSLFVVRYRAPVVVPVPPDTCIVARVADDRGGSTFAAQVVAAARALAVDQA